MPRVGVRWEIKISRTEGGWKLTGTRDKKKKPLLAAASSRPALGVKLTEMVNDLDGHDEERVEIGEKTT